MALPQTIRIGQDINNLYLALIRLADLELKMTSMETIDTEMAGDQEILRLKLNEMINIWK